MHMQLVRAGNIQTTGWQTLALKVLQRCFEVFLWSNGYTVKQYHLLTSFAAA